MEGIDRGTLSIHLNHANLYMVSVSWHIFEIMKASSSYYPTYPVNKVSIDTYICLEKNKKNI